ncbi:MAG: glycoside hydrolase family 3 C-terminal domain-containing protein [Fibrobacterales bacterium]
MIRTIVKKLPGIALLIPVLVSFGNAKTIDERIDSIVALMSRTQKIEQLNNNGFMSTADDVELGIPGFKLGDGPHGVRPNMAPGLTATTVFPLAISMAAMWDHDMWYQAGVAMGEEFAGADLHIQLGPSIDLSHDPRNGRSGESGGEDSYLIGQYAENVVQGIQINPVIATIKHYTAVNKQWDRKQSDIAITEQMLMDQHGYHYRKAVQEGGALSVMSSYNLINGVHTNESKLLLTDILKDRWGFPFFVMSDWWAVWNAAGAINAGNDVLMGEGDPNQYRDVLPGAMDGGTVTMATLDASVKRVLKTKMLFGMMDTNFPDADISQVNSEEHQAFIRKADQKAMVLLKNEGNVLPIPKNKTVALIGPSADVTRYNIGGSSHVNPPYTITPYQAFKEAIGAENVTHLQGCEIDGQDISQFADAISLAESHDYVVFVGGLSDLHEGEHDGNDRETIELPEVQRWMIDEVSKVNSNVVVVLQSGGILGVDPFIDQIQGLLYAFYTTQEGGHAMADIIFGDYNPAGRLPVTLPKAESFMPDWDLDFTNDYLDGYRYYDETEKEYQFAFGYGLSYTTYAYSDIEMYPASPSVGDRVSVRFNVTNTGDVDGEEVVQLYMTNDASPIWMPKKELKGFERVAIAAGETKQVTLALEVEDFFHFKQSILGYSVASGEYTVSVGGSSDSLPISKQFTMNAQEEKSDLQPVNLYMYPRYPAVGDNVQLVATIKNYGSVATKANDIIVSWVIDGQQVAESRPITEPIPAGGMIMVSSDPELSGSGFWTPSSSTPVAIEVVVDSEGTESETYEENNSAEFITAKVGGYLRQPYEYPVFPEVVDESSSDVGESSADESSVEDTPSSSAADISSEDTDESSEVNVSSDDHDVSPIDPSNKISLRNQYEILNITNAGESVPVTFARKQIEVYSVLGTKVWSGIGNSAPVLNAGVYLIKR